MDITFTNKKGWLTVTVGNNSKKFRSSGEFAAGDIRVVVMKIGSGFSVKIVKTVMEREIGEDAEITVCLDYRGDMDREVIKDKSGKYIQ